MKVEKKNNGSFLEFLGKTSRNFLMGIDFRDRLFKLKSINNRGSDKNIFTIDERNAIRFNQDVYLSGKLVLDRALIERINKFVISNIKAEATFTFGDTEHDDVNNGTIQLISYTGTTITYKIKNDDSADATAANPEFNSGINAKQTARNFIELIHSSNGHDGEISASYEYRGEDTDGKVILKQGLPGESGNTTITTASSFDNACDINAPATFRMTNEINKENFKNFTTLLLDLDEGLDIILPDTSDVGVTSSPTHRKTTDIYDVVYGRRLYIKRIDRGSYTCKIKSGNASLLKKVTVSFQSSVAGSIVSAGEKYVQLDGSASSTDDIYNDLLIEITGGDAKGDIRKIVNYQGTDKIATVDKPFTVIPDRIVASTYNVFAAIKDSINDFPFSVGDVIKVEGASNSGNNSIFTIATISQTTSTLGLSKGETLTAETASNAISIYSGLINNDKELNILSGDYIDLICDGDRWYTKNSSLIDRQLQINGQLIIDEIPSTDVRATLGGKGLVYVQNDAPNTLKFKDDGGSTYNLGSNWHGSTTTIKILPSDFLTNDGSANKPVHYDDTSATGLRVTATASLLIATVSIPLGYKATAVTIYDINATAVVVYEADVNTGSIASKGTGNCNTEINITDVTATATNYLVIKVTTTAAGDRIRGGIVDIERA